MTLRHPVVAIPIGWWCWGPWLNTQILLRLKTWGLIKLVCVIWDTNVCVTWDMTHVTHMYVWFETHTYVWLETWLMRHTCAYDMRHTCMCDLRHTYMCDMRHTSVCDLRHDSWDTPYFVETENSRLNDTPSTLSTHKCVLKTLEHTLWEWISRTTSTTLPNRLRSGPKLPS